MVLQKQKLWNRDFISIFLSNFFIFTTFYTLLATLPMFVMETLDGTDQQVGLVMTSFIIAAVIFRPIAGKWVDELGRKKILLIFVTVFVLSTFLYLSVASVIFLLALRFVHGISFGVVTTATGAIASDLVPEERKGEGIGYFAMSMNLAMVLGPFIGLTLANRYGFFVLFVILSVLALLALLFGNTVRIPKKEAAAKEQGRTSLHWKNFIEPKAVPLSLTALILSFAYSGILTFIPVYAKELGVVEAASYFYVIYAIMIVLSRPIIGRLFDRFGEHVIIYPSIFLYVIGLVTLSQAHSATMFLTSGAIIGLGFGTLFPSFQTVALRLTPMHRRGLATGTYLLFYDIGIGLGSVILGSIAAAATYQDMYAFSAVEVSLAAVLYYFLHHRKTRKTAKNSMHESTMILHK